MNGGILFLIGLTIVLLFVLALVVVALRFDERKNRAPQIAVAARQILDATERARQDVARFESAVRNVAGALSSSPVASSADSSAAGEESDGLPGLRAQALAGPTRVDDPHESVRATTRQDYRFLTRPGDGADHRQ